MIGVLAASDDQIPESQSERVGNTIHQTCTFSKISKIPS